MFLEKIEELKQEYAVDFCIVNGENASENNGISRRTAEKLLDMKNEKTGYTFARLPGYFVNLFSISAQGKSAFDVLNNHLYNYSYCAETITLNALPSRMI